MKYKNSKKEKLHYEAVFLHEEKRKEIIDYSTILYYITNAQCSFGGRQCDYSGSGSISASKRNDAARADDFKGKEVYQSGY